MSLWWKRSRADLAKERNYSMALKSRRRDNPSSLRKIKVTPARTVAYSNLVKSKSKSTTDRDLKNQVAFDAFIVANRELYIFSSP